MSTLTNMFQQISGKIMDNCMSLHRFDHLVYAIFKNKHEQFIFDPSIKIIIAEQKQSPLSVLLGI
ncbi:Bgt-50997 [Blumeria graminis f. sp. tritici]|uniref:Bgt-50997 n=1 Tax=Blumeria graminis f. sp. tritici TaxID=62690 RepID=A0A9X9L9L9_BLUGR|nr:Bgt-50997 [Blumeria graminis f. sp. tritici]